MTVKKIVLSAYLLLFSLLSLSAVSLIAGADVNADGIFLQHLEDVINKEEGGLIPEGTGTLHVDSYSEDGNAVYVTIEGYTLAFDRDDLHNSMESEVRAFFTYPVFLDRPSSDVLEYIHGSSYSTFSLSSARKGDVYDLILPANDKAAGRFIVSSVNEDTGLVQLDPVYVKKAFTGLSLEKRSSWAASLSFSQVFTPSYLAAGAVRVKNTSWLYPFNFSFGFETGQTGSDVYFAALAGLEYNAYLGSLLDSSFTFIQDARLYAGTDIVLGFCRGFLWGASWRVGYAHSLSRFFSWSAGYENIVLNSVAESKEVLVQHRLSVGIGVMF